MNMSYCTFIGNIKKEHGIIAIQAGRDTGFNIWIENNATDVFGNPIDYFVELHSSENKDHEPFWKRYKELKNE